MNQRVDNEDVDPACVKQVLNGDCHAYRDIVQRYENRVFSLLYMMIRDRFAAEEVMQDAFLRAYANLHKFDLERPFYPWLATIAVRLGINWTNRTGAKRVRETSTFDVTNYPADNSSPVDELEARQNRDKLWEHVARLPQGERAAVLMFYQQELNLSEIAGILGVTKGTVKTFLHRGRTHLRTRIEVAGGSR